MLNRFAGISRRELRQITHALLLEWVSDVSVSDRGTFVDFGVTSTSTLGLQHRQRFRLFPQPIAAHDIAQLRMEAAAVDRSPILVAPMGLEDGVEVPADIPLIDANSLYTLCQESAIVVAHANDQLEIDRVEIDRAILRELKDRDDVRFSFVNGLLWLRPLSRNRVPPPLRWTGRPAHELFERCFFLAMTTTFRGSGTSWGTKKRGQPIPDGELLLPGLHGPVLYDCKAATGGYSMSYRDLTGFVDYLQASAPASRGAPGNESRHFLVVSSEIHGGQREASFTGRQKALSSKVPGSRLTWMRAPDLVRFGLLLEAGEVAPTGREAISWAEILDAGDVHWDVFQVQLGKLRELGHAMPETD